MERRVKNVMPSWREKKRYLAFEVLSKSNIKAFADVSKAVWQSHLAASGELGAAKAGLQMLKWNPALSRGLMRVNHDQVDQLRLSLALIEQINSQPVIIRGVGVSGSVKKASERYLAS